MTAATVAILGVLASSGSAPVAAATRARSTSEASSGPSLSMALSFNPGSLDPDIFYGNEGLEVTMSCYDGLLAYADNTTQIVPDLATSYAISNSGRTYTFHLRPNVRFVDGTRLTSSAIEFDINRRRAVNGGPAYMVAPIVSMSTPNSLTLVINLKTPENPFLSWLASPYGLKAVSPSLVRAHEKNDKLAETWLATHCAGTGPYTLTQAQPDQRFILTANPYYWGPKPYYKQVVFNVIPSFSTQQLELRSGQLDIMSHGIPQADLAQYAGSSSLQVLRLPGISAINLWINPHKPNLKATSTRRAISLALDRPELVDEVYGDANATVYNGLFAPDTLPAKYDYNVPYNPAEAASIMKSVPATRRSVQLLYTTDDASNEQIAGLIAEELDSVGFTVTLRGVPETEVFDYSTDPLSQQPAMIVLPQNPDDASPSSFAQLQWLSAPGTGSFFPPFDPAADKVLTEAEESNSPAMATQLYGKAAQMYAGLYAMVPIANTKTVVVAQKDITGIAVARQGLWTVDIARLRAS